MDSLRDSISDFIRDYLTRIGFERDLSKIMAFGLEIMILVVALLAVNCVGWHICRLYFMPYAKCRTCGYQAPAVDFRGKCPKCGKECDLKWEK